MIQLPLNINPAKREISRFAGKLRQVRGEVAASDDASLAVELESLQASVKENSEPVVPAACLLRSVFTKLGELSRAHRESYVGRLVETIQTLKRRERFREKLVVVCFGKVGSGKSTLGNFIGKSLGAEFYVREGDCDRPISHFEVDDLPVSGVRYFLTGDLVWIDAPGRFAQDERDDRDALKAIEEADVLLFLSDFRQAMDIQEREALRRTISRLPDRDQFAWSQCSTLVLSHADRRKVVDARSGKVAYLPFREDEVAGLLDYVGGLLSSEAIAGAFRAAVVFSTRLAESAGSMKSLRMSGLPGLLEKIVGSISIGRVNLKKNNLLRNLGTLRHDCRTLTESYMSGVEELRQEIARSIEGARNGLGELRSSLSAELTRLGLEIMNSLLRSRQGHTNVSWKDVEEMNAAFAREFREQLFGRLNSMLEQFAVKHFEGFRIRAGDLALEFNVPVVIDRKKIKIKGGRSSSSKIRQKLARRSPRAESEVAGFSDYVAEMTRRWLWDQIDRTESDFEKLLNQWQGNLSAVASRLEDLYENLALSGRENSTGPAEPETYAEEPELEAARV